MLTFVRGKQRLRAGVSLAVAASLGFASWRIANRVRTSIKNRRLPARTRILILGAGFGGREAALCLAKHIPNCEDAEITLVDREPFLLFTPMLTEAAGGELDTHHIASSVLELPRRINFIQGTVQDIDVRSRHVKVLIGDSKLGIPEREETLAADHVVIALGSVTNFHSIPGLEENAFTMKSLADAGAVHERILMMLQRANEEPDAQARKQMLTVVVGGGGFTGVETMAAINDLIRDGSRKFPRVSPREIRTILAHPEDRILPELSPELAAYAQDQLRRRGVEIRLNTKISSAGPDFVEFNEKERIASRTLIWAGGVAANPVLAALACPHGPHGTVTVDSFLAIPNAPGVWALGDSAHVPQRGGKGWYAPTAQNAVREGSLVASNILARLRGGNPKPFTFEPIGELALVGRHSGVGNIMGIRFNGFLAWAMWRVVYWSKMPSLSQKLRILSDWLLDLAFGRNLVLLSDHPAHKSLFPRPEPPPPKLAPPPKPEPSPAVGVH